eukprot:CAMPEP_0117440904 /NCGR_PEP_ID=MMETSP0759-20121206/3341_1 /TAXON_ID=63605 /ORGANISM="Percolomonas cosmopolitus, Strain WS" /LENGTH=540 /DNA_ID=CAMNT_0005232705 /DNA_START=82 /DNA_END=1704 /DNA_ORIENTATION=-
MTLHLLLVSLEKSSLSALSRQYRHKASSVPSSSLSHMFFWLHHHEQQQQFSFFQKRHYRSSGKKVSDKYGFDPLREIRNTRRKQPKRIEKPKYVSTEELFNPTDESQQLYNVVNKEYLQRKQQDKAQRRGDILEEEFELLRHKVALKEINTVTRDVILSDNDQQRAAVATNLDESEIMLDAYNEPIERRDNEPYIKDRYYYILEELKKDLFDIQQVMRGHLSTSTSDVEGEMPHLDYNDIGLNFKPQYLEELDQWGQNIGFDAPVAYLLRCFVSSDFVIKNAKNHEALMSNQFLYMNRQMEALGEKILSLSVELFLERHYSDIVQGDLTKLRHLMVSEQVLSKVAELMGMKRFYLNPEYEDEGPTVLRSLIGTTFMKSGYESCLRMIWDQILPKIIQVSQQKKLTVYYIEHLEYLVKYYAHTIPQYKRHNVPRDNGTYIVGVYVNDRLMAEGYGKSVHDAQLDAAISCYCEIMKDKGDAYFMPNYQDKHTAAEDSKQLLQRRREHQLLLLEEARKQALLESSLKGQDGEVKAHLEASTSV